MKCNALRFVAIFASGTVLIGAILFSLVWNGIIILTPHDILATQV